MEGKILTNTTMYMHVVLQLLYVVTPAKLLSDGERLMHQHKYTSLYICLQLEYEVTSLCDTNTGISYKFS